MYGLHRGAWTLIGASGALVLVWVATVMPEHTTGGYWATYGLIAAGGLSLSFSQLLGGWTKWGWPRVSGSVFLIGFVPAFVVSAWILVVTEPHGGWQQGRVTGWSSDLGVTHFIDSVGPYKAALALGLGVVFGFTFDTAGPRRREVVEAPGTAAAPVPDGPVADEPIAHDRTPDA
jgi:hypothetical protein